MITSHDILEPLKQVLSASRDVTISGQICGSNRGKFIRLGDGCWLPNLAAEIWFTKPEFWEHLVVEKPRKTEDRVH